MIFDTLTTYEKELIMVGYDKMGVTNQNSLINAIAKKLGISVLQVTATNVLDHHKNIKIAMQNEFYEMDVSGGFVASNGHRYRTNADDQTNFIGRLVMLLYFPEVTEVNWKAEDTGDYITHTKEEWVKIAFEGFAYKEAQLTKYNDKYKAIKNATTHDQIVAVSWSGTTPNK